MTRDTCWTSIPRANKSVVIRTREDPERNSRMMTSRSFWSMSPCCKKRGRNLEYYSPSYDQIPVGDLGAGDITVIIIAEHVIISRQNWRSRHVSNPANYLNFEVLKKKLTMAETVKSRVCIFSVNQSTFLRVLQKMTACVIVKVSYRSHNVSNFHSSRSTLT